MSLPQIPNKNIYVYIFMFHYVLSTVCIKFQNTAKMFICAECINFDTHISLLKIINLRTTNNDSTIEEKIFHYV